MVQSYAQFKQALHQACRKGEIPQYLHIRDVVEYTLNDASKNKIVVRKNHVDFFLELNCGSASSLLTEIGKQDASLVPVKDIITNRQAYVAANLGKVSDSNIVLVFWGSAAWSKEACENQYTVIWGACILF